MRATRIEARLRGLDIRVDLSAPVTILVGPNGSGKSTALAAMVFAATGTAFDRRSRRRRPGEVLEVLDSQGQSVDARLMFPDGPVHRVITRTATGASTSLQSPWSGPLESQRDVDRVIASRIGDPTALDVQDFLRLPPKDRRQRLIQLCAESTPRVTNATLLEQLGERMGEDCFAWFSKAFTLDADALPVERLSRVIDAIRQHAADSRARKTQVIAAIRSAAAESSEDRPSGTSAAVRAEVDVIKARIGNAASREALIRWRADEERLSALRVRRSSLLQQQAAIADAAVDASDIEALRAELAEAEHGSFDKAVRIAFDEARPSAGFPSDLAAFSEGVRLAERVVAIQHLDRDVAAIRLDLAEAESLVADQKQTLRDIQRDIDRVDIEIRRLTESMPAERPVEADADAEVRLAGLHSLLERLLVHEERDRLHNTWQAQRIEADRDLAFCNIATGHVEAMRDGMINHALALFGGICNKVLPDGWTIDGDFTVRRGDVETGLAALSDGELAMCTGGFAAALAALSACPWRVLLADNIGLLSSDPDAGSPNGRLLRFVEGIADAVRSGLLSQAVMASCRLTSQEVEALRLVDGVEVVFVGRSSLWLTDDVSRVNAWVDAADPALVEELYRRIGAAWPGTLTVARGLMVESARAAGATPTQVMEAINSIGDDAGCLDASAAT